MHKHRRGNTPVAIAIGRLWKKELEQTGETFGLKELARRIGMNQPTLFRLYTGETSNPKKHTVQRLLDYFDITFEQLLTNKVDGEEHKDTTSSARAKAIARKFDALPQRAKQVIAELIEILEEQDKKHSANVIHLTRK